MSPRKNSYQKQASVPVSAEDRWIPANSAKAKSFLPKLNLHTLNVPAEPKAVLSHWAQTLGTPFAKPFEPAALEILEGKKAPDETAAEALPQILFLELFEVPFPPPKKPKFTFIDLFAGIGGFRIAMQNLGGKCVFSSEWDSQASKTYETNYGEIPFGDITKEETKQFIPDNFDILCAGFPCQAFSLAGKRREFEEIALRERRFFVSFTGENSGKNLSGEKGFFLFVKQSQKLCALFGKICQRRRKRKIVLHFFK